MRIEDITTITNQIITPKDLFLVDLKISKSNVIEVFIDALQGVNIQTCIEVSKKIESKFDREEEDFELTVASAGIGYPFKVDGQFQKGLNKTIEVELKDSLKTNGILKSYNTTEIVIERYEKKLLEGKKRKEMVKVERTINREDIKCIKEAIKF